MKKVILIFLFIFLSTNVCAESIFSGPYLGLQLGYADGRDDSYQIRPPSVEPNGETSITKPAGSLYGLSAGYNKVFSNDLLLGIAFNIEGRGVKDESQPIVNGSPIAGFIYRTKSKGSISIMPKLGYLLGGGDTLIYVTSGYELAKIERKLLNNDSGDINYGRFDSSSSWQGGWASGLGLERVVYKNTTAMIEYRYTDWGNYDFKNGASNNQPIGTWVNKYSYKEQSIRLGLNYHF